MILSEKDLNKFYLEDKKSIVEIAKIANVNSMTIHKYLKRYNIPRRNRGGKVIDIKGQRFGRLIVDSYIGSGKNNNSLWHCKCDCGGTKDVTRENLVRHATQSCGCLAHESRIQTCRNRRTGGIYLTGSQYCTIRHCAKQRNIDFNITIEDIEKIYKNQNFKCAYTEIELYFNYYDENNNLIQNSGNASVDRICSNYPYNISNIQIVHKDINLMKHILSEEKFLNYIKQIYEYKIK